VCVCVRVCVCACVCISILGRVPWESLQKSHLSEGTQFTCFTGTKVQILTSHLSEASALIFEASARPKGPILHRYSVYLLYWYKSTNTDAAPTHRIECAEEGRESSARRIAEILSNASGVRKAFYKPAVVVALQKQQAQELVLRQSASKVLPAQQLQQVHSLYLLYTGAKVQILTRLSSSSWYSLCLLYTGTGVQTLTRQLQNSLWRGWRSTCTHFTCCTLVQRYKH
jgi:hypothetical protein